MSRRAVYVWDWPVRLTHWAIVGSILLLSVTGIYIGHPFLVGGQFVMGWMKVLHFYGAIVFTLSVLARIAWMFLGNQYARWDQFIPVARQRRRDMVSTLLFYMFVKPRPPEGAGHNPLAGASYLAVFGLYLLMVATGLGLYAASADAGSIFQSFAFLARLFGGLQLSRWIHHVTMWLLIGFAVHHVYSAMLTATVEKNGEIDSIITGYKSLERKDG